MPESISRYEKTSWHHYLSENPSSNLWGQNQLTPAIHQRCCIDYQRYNPQIISTEIGEFMSDYADIQVQENTGYWLTYIRTRNDPQFILVEMKSLKQSYPEKRVRAIDENGRLIDMLN